MKVKGTKTEQSTVIIDVSPIDVLETLREYLLSQYGLDRDCYLEGGQVCRQVEYRGSHSWSEKEVLMPKPSNEIVNLILTFDSLKRLIQDIR